MGFPLPKRWTAERLLRTRSPLLANREHHLVLIYTPKSGCTFAVKWFFAQTGLLEQALAFGPWIHD